MALTAARASHRRRAGTLGDARQDRCRRSCAARVCPARRSIPAPGAWSAAPGGTTSTSPGRGTSTCSPAGRRAGAETPAMVAARADFLAAGHFDFLPTRWPWPDPPVAATAWARRRRRGGYRATTWPRCCDRPGGAWPGPGRGQAGRAPGGPRPPAGVAAAVCDIWRGAAGRRRVRRPGPRRLRAAQRARVRPGAAPRRRAAGGDAPPGAPGRTGRTRSGCSASTRTRTNGWTRRCGRGSPARVDTGTGSGCPVPYRRRAIGRDGPERLAHPISRGGAAAGSGCRTAAGHRIGNPACL